MKPVLLTSFTDFCRKSINKDNYKECGILLDENYEKATVN